MNDVEAARARFERQWREWRGCGQRHSQPGRRSWLAPLAAVGAGLLLAALVRRFRRSGARRRLERGG